jgi:hypothetical protein
MGVPPCFPLHLPLQQRQPSTACSATGPPSARQGPPCSPPPPPLWRYRMRPLPQPWDRCVAAGLPFACAREHFESAVVLRNHFYLHAMVLCCIPMLVQAYRRLPCSPRLAVDPLLLGAGSSSSTLPATLRLSYGAWWSTGAGEQRRPCVSHPLHHPSLVRLHGVVGCRCGSRCCAPGRVDSPRPWCQRHRHRAQ